MSYCISVQWITVVGIQVDACIVGIGKQREYPSVRDDFATTFYSVHRIPSLKTDAVNFLEMNGCFLPVFSFLLVGFLFWLPILLLFLMSSRSGPNHSI